MEHRARWVAQSLLSLVMVCSMQGTRAAEPGKGLDARRTFAIPAQPMSSALLAFSTQADIQVMTASKELQGRIAQAVSGEHIVRDALYGLLDGSGMRFHVISETAVSVELDDGSGKDQKITGDASSGAHSWSVLDSVKATHPVSVADISPQ